MKKVKLLSLMLPFLILGVNQEPAALSIGLKADNAYQTQNETLASFFAGAYSLNSTITSSHSGDTHRILTETDDSHLNVEVYDSKDNLLSADHYRKVGNNTVLDSLSLSNEVVSSNVIDSEESPVNFANYFSGPFKTMASVNRLSSSFEISRSSDGNLIYTANEIGLGLLLNDFLNNFQTFNDYTWDTTTVNQYLKDLVITTDSTGLPLKFSCYLVTADRFGGTYEIIESEFSKLDSVSTLTSMEPVLDEESDEYTALVDALNALYTKILDGNFIEYVDLGSNSTFNQKTYKNYYDFDKEGKLNEETTHLNLMLSNYELIDTNQGSTFTGLNYGTIYLYDEEQTTLNAYYGYGISPDSDYADILYSNYWTDMADVLPKINTISPDYFDYDQAETIYTFELSSFPFLDYNFGFSILDALLGQGDYLSHVQPTYTADSNYSSFDFSKLTIDLSETDKPVFALTYTNSTGTENTTTVYFDDFGTADMHQDANLQRCLAVIGLDDK